VAAGPMWGASDYAASSVDLGRGRRRIAARRGRTQAKTCETRLPAASAQRPRYPLCTPMANAEQTAMHSANPSVGYGFHWSSQLSSQSHPAAAATAAVCIRTMQRMNHAPRR